MPSDAAQQGSASGGFSTFQLVSLSLIVVLSGIVKYSLGILTWREAAVPLGIFTLGVVALFFSLTAAEPTVASTTPDCCTPTKRTTAETNSESMIGYATEKPSAKQPKTTGKIELGTSNFFYRPLSSIWVGVALIYLGSGALFQRLNIFHPENISPSWWKVFIFIPVVGGFFSLFTQYFAVQKLLEERKKLDASGKEGKGTTKTLNANESDKSASRNIGQSIDSQSLNRLLLTDRAFLSLLMTTVWLFLLGLMVVMFGDDLRSILMPFFLVYCVGVFVTESLL